MLTRVELEFHIEDLLRFKKSPILNCEERELIDKTIDLLKELMKGGDLNEPK